MGLKRMQYDVAIEKDGEVVEHRILVRHGDMLRGELEAGKQGLPSVQAAPMNNTTVWVWCALVREGLVDVDYREFKTTQLVALAMVKDANGESQVTDVDPTQPAPSGSPSPSPSPTAEAPATGSTPT